MHNERTKAGNKRCSSASAGDTPAEPLEQAMNNIIYIVGLVVVVIAVLSFFGLR